MSVDKGVFFYNYEPMLGANS